MRLFVNRSVKNAWLACLLLVSAPLAPAASKLTARFYYMEDTMASMSLQAHSADLGVLSPVWFTVAPQGELRSTVDPKLVAWAAERKLPIMPVIVNLDFKPEVVEAAIADGTRDKLIASIVKAATSSHFSGLELDFEELPASTKDSFTRFARQLAEALHHEKMLLGIAVPAPLIPASPLNVSPQAWTANPRAAAFDNNQLGRFADSLTLMAYDEYTAVDQAGPVAGLPWVEACVRKTLTAVSPQKLLLGLALYYRHWNGTTVTEGPFPVARALAAKSGVNLALNQMQREMTFGFSEGTSKHVVWGEDATNLSARFDLIGKYKLGGYAVWRLGQEDPAVWKTIFHQGQEGKKQ